MRAPSLQILFRHPLWQRPHDLKDLSIKIPQSRLRIRVPRRRQARDVAIRPLMPRMQARRALDIRIRSHGPRRPPCRARAQRRLQVPLQHQRRQALRRLRDVRVGEMPAAVGGGAVGGERRGGAGGGGGLGRGRAAVVLRREHGGFFAGGFAEDLLDVFVASLGGPPVRVAEGAGLECEVEGVEELLVGVVDGGRGGWGWHCG